jgi:hypothetical protein
VFGNYTKALTGKGYWAHYQLRSVRKHGGLSAIKRYLAKPQPQEGFDHMSELNTVDLSIEALVLQRPWRSLFTRDELETARGRLAAVGYNPADSGASG